MTNNTIKFLLILILFSSCSITDKSQRGFKFSAQAGLNKGGIAENTDLSIVSNAKTPPQSSVDAFSGATKMGGNVGVHINKPLWLGEIETGMNYMYNFQTFTFADQGNMYFGVRKLHVNQFMMPLTYNIILLKKTLPNAEIQLKFGFLAQFNVVSTIEDKSSSLPEYLIDNSSNGAVFGISAYPLKFDNGSKLGFYLDAYRGSRIYTDFYNKKDFEMPGSSFVKFGVRYQFKTVAN